MRDTIRHKYKAVRNVRDGIKFPSLKEGRYYDELKLRVRAGEVLFFLRQTPFHLPGGIKYVCDFIEFWTNGEVHIIETKGFKTTDYKAKKKMVEALYPIKIEEK